MQNVVPTWLTAWKSTSSCATKHLLTSGGVGCFFLRRLNLRTQSWKKLGPFSEVLVVRFTDYSWKEQSLEMFQLVVARFSVRVPESRFKGKSRKTAPGFKLILKTGVVDRCLWQESLPDLYTVMIES